jgi:hypothetical protein
MPTPEERLAAYWEMQREFEDAEREERPPYWETELAEWEAGQ